MHTRRRIVVLLVGVLLALAALQSTRPAADTTFGGGGPLAPVGGAPANAGARDGGVGQPADAQNGVKVGYSVKNDVSLPLRMIKPQHGNGLALPAEEENHNAKLPIVGHQDVADPVVQRSHRTSSAASAGGPVVGPDFAGIDSVGSGCHCLPPDPNGAAGLSQYVQMVNHAFQIFSKTGTSLYGPATINTVWSDFGGPCQASNDGDPIALYDAMANRWLISQFTASAPYYECIAVSTSSDATGSWNRYAFLLSTSNLQDYPHLGVWPDGYYMSTIQFTNGSTAAGPVPYVFDRTKMIAGQAATFETFPALGPNAAPLLPADLNGATLPPAGAPNYFAQVGTRLSIYKFHVDWSIPANTTFTNSANLQIAGYTELCATTRNCVPQLGTTRKLDGIGDRLMFRLAYRNFGDHEALVVNHSVDVGDDGIQAGVRWYEVRNPGRLATIFQQGTFAPDSDSRWMGSAAMDMFGDIAVGYSVSSRGTFPSIRYATRSPHDPPGTLSDERSMVVGRGSQTNATSRWGDYSDLTVDPSDDCTFWYTQEYYTATSDSSWSTRIGSFKFPRCGTTPTLWLPIILK